MEPADYLVYLFKRLAKVKMTQASLFFHSRRERGRSAFVFGRRNAELLLEGRGEIGQRAETRHVRDFAHVVFSLFEEILGPVQFVLLEEHARILPGQGLHLVIELRP